MKVQFKNGNATIGVVPARTKIKIDLGALKKDELVEGEREATLECIDCGFTTANLEAMQDHQKKVFCPFCGKLFCSVMAMIQHDGAEHK